MAREPGRALTRWNLELEGRTVENAAWTYREPDAARAALKDHVAFYWGKLDAWFEEDEEVFVHPRDPHKRVDVLPSSRHVRVEVDGQVVADTQHPSLLFETGLPTRYYIPQLDVRLDLLESSPTTTQCPYKGKAVYWSIRAGDTLHKDLVWSYPFPIAECPKIEKLMAFYNEKLDIYVDGELQGRAKDAMVLELAPSRVSARAPARAAPPRRSPSPRRLRLSARAPSRRCPGTVAPLEHVQHLLLAQRGDWPAADWIRA